MQVLQSHSYLVNNIAIMDIFEDVLGDYVVQVGLDVLEDEIHISIVLCLDSLVQLYDVRVLNLS